MTPELRELLEDIREYLDQRADCDIPSGESPRPNEAMILLARLDCYLQSIDPTTFDGFLRQAVSDSINSKR